MSHRYIITEQDKRNVRCYRCEVHDDVGDVLKLFIKRRIQIANAVPETTLFEVKSNQVKRHKAHTSF